MRIGRIRRDRRGVRVEASGRRMLLVAIFMALVAVGMGAATVIELGYPAIAVPNSVALTDEVLTDIEQRRATASAP